MRSVKDIDQQIEELKEDRKRAVEHEISEAITKVHTTILEEIIPNYNMGLITGIESLDQIVEYIRIADNKHNLLILNPK